MTKAVVLLSGGQDSTTCLYWALREFGAAEVSTLGVDYGQRHAAELEAAAQIAAGAGVPYRVVAVPALRQLADSSLTRAGVAHGWSGGYVDREAPNGLPTSYIPSRNLVFLALAAAETVQLGATRIVTGVCETDYSGYPDCRQVFITAAQAAINLALPSSCGPLELVTPLMHLTKADTVRLANVLPGCWPALAQTVTCYQGRRPGCGACPACVLRARGFAEAAMKDPAE